MSDDVRRLILARRARFVAATLAGAAITVTSASARADDASVDDAGDDAGDAASADGDDGGGGDAGDGGVFVEAGARDFGDPDADPRPCLSIAAPPEPCLCVMAPKANDSEAGIAPAALAAAAALVAARRRRTKKDG